MAAITVRCGSCGHSMRFGADKLGKKARCTKCQEIVRVEEAAASAPAAAEAPPPVPPVPANPGAYSVPTADEIGAYGLDTPEEKKEAEPEKKKKKEKKAKVLRKVKAIEDGEQWDKVRMGLLLMAIGAWLWLGAHVLQGLYVALGNADYPDYDRLVMTQIKDAGPFNPANGPFWNVSSLNIVLGMIAGLNFLGFAWVCLFLAVLLRIGQLLLWGTGYAIALAVPNRFGTSGQAITLLCLACWNFLMVLILMLLPVVGAISYFNVPIVTPEIGMTTYNMERSVPLTILWMVSPFWEMLLALLVLFVLYLEPVIGCVFVWSIGRSLKEQALESQALGLMQLGLGQFFVLLAFHLFSADGASPVLVTVLRVLYVVWYAFLMLFILQYPALLLKTRAILDKKINPENEAE